MDRKVYSSSIKYNFLLRFSDKKIEEKYNRKLFSFQNISLFYLLIFMLCIANYLMNMNLIKNLNIIQDQKSNKNNIDEISNQIHFSADLNLNEMSYNKIFAIRKDSEKLETFLILNISVLIIFFCLKIFLWFIKNQISKKDNNKFNFSELDMNPENIDYKKSNSNINEKSDLNNPKDFSNLHSILQLINSYIDNLVLLLLASFTIFQLILLKFLLIWNFSLKNIIPVFPYLHSMVILIFINFVSFNYLINFFGFLFGNLYILFFINNEVITYALYKNNILELNFTFEYCFLYLGLIFTSWINYNTNLKYRLNFLKLQDHKLNFLKLNDSFQNMNSGFISCGENMNIFHNKKFSQIFTHLINDIICNEKKYENTLSLIKILKIDKHLDERAKNLETAKYFEKQSLINNLDINSALYLNKTALTIKKSKVFDNPEKKYYKKITKFDELNFQGNRQNLNEENSSNLILLLLFFDKKSIKLQSNLEIQLKNYVEEFLLVNMEADDFICDIVNLKFSNYLNKINNKKSNFENLRNFNNTSLLKNKVNIIENECQNHDELNENDLNKFKNVLNKKEIFENILEKKNSNLKIEVENQEVKINLEENNFINKKQTYPNFFNINNNESIFNNSNYNFLNNWFNNLNIENAQNQGLGDFKENDLKNKNKNNPSESNLNLKVNNSKIKQSLKNENNSNNYIYLNEGFDCNLNSVFLNFFNSKILCFKEFINLIRTNYSYKNEYSKFFSYKKLLNKDGIEEMIYLDVFIRYSKFSDKVEFLINDISQISEISDAKAKRKIKKKFMNKISHEFRNPILNIIQLIKNIKHNNIIERTSSIETKSNLKNLIFRGNKNKIPPKKKKSSFENSNISDKTRLINNVEFSAFAIYKEILEKENFFKRNLLVSNKSSSCEFNSNYEFSNNISADLFNSRTNIENRNLQNLNNITFLNQNEIINNKISQTVRNKKNILEDLKIDKIEFPKNFINKKESDKILKSTQIISQILHKNDISKNINNFEFVDYKSTLSNDIYSKNIIKKTNEKNIHNFYYDKSYLKSDQDKSSFQEQSKNFISNLNNANDKFLLNSYEIINELNHIKYICNALNYIINDFEFFTNIDIDSKHKVERFSGRNIENIIRTDKDCEINEKSLKNLGVEKSIFIRFDVHKLINKIIKIFRSKIFLIEKNIVINLEIDESVCKYIKSSSERISQILFNLLSNSLKFTKVGFINLKVRYDPSDLKLFFNISDSGIGISQEYLNHHIFKPFSRIKDDKHNIYGIGLGLYVVKLYIKSLYGDIHVESKENEFTNITFSIKIENAITSLNETIKSRDRNTNSSQFLIDTSLKLNKEEFKKSILKKKESNSNSLIDVNFKDNKKTQLTKKFCDLIEIENFSHFEMTSYEDNLMSATNRPQIEKIKSFFSQNYNNKDYDKNSIIGNHIDDSNKFPNPSIQKKRIIKNFKEDKGEKNFILKKSKSIEVTIKTQREYFKNMNNFNNVKNYNKTLIINNKALLNRIKDKYSLTIYRENSKVNWQTTRNSNLNTLNNNCKDLNGFRNYYKYLSKFSNNSYRKDDLNSCKDNETFFEYNFHSPKQNVINSDSSMGESINNMQQMVSKNNSKRNFPLSNSNNEMNNLNANSNKQIENINRQFRNTLALKGKSLQDMSSSCITVDFEKEYNFNYNAIISANPKIFPTINNSKKDSKSDDICLNKSNLNQKDIKSQTDLSLSNRDENQIKKILNEIDSSVINSNIQANINCLNLKGIKNKENKNMINYFIYDKEIAISKNNFQEYFTRRMTNIIRILVVDDEKLIRQSNINLINKFFKNKNIYYQIYECEDGFNCLNYIYQAKLVGKDFNFIITDQTMNYITGTLLSSIIGLLVEQRVINEIKMFLVTSYSANLFDKQKNRFIKVFSKPLRMEHLEFIFNDLFSK